MKQKVEYEIEKSCGIKTLVFRNVGRTDPMNKNSLKHGSLKTFEFDIFNPPIETLQRFFVILGIGIPLKLVFVL